MPWKLVVFLISLVLAAFFIGFNLDNRCDVSLVLYTFKDVPIFVSLLFAFVAGALAVIPFLIGHSPRPSHPKQSQSPKRPKGPREAED